MVFENVIYFVIFLLLFQNRNQNKSKETSREAYESLVSRVSASVLSFWKGALTALQQHCFGLRNSRSVAFDTCLILKNLKPGINVANR